MFQGRMAEAEKAYLKETGIPFNSTNRQILYNNERTRAILA